MSVHYFICGAKHKISVPCKHKLLLKMASIRGNDEVSESSQNVLAHHQEIRFLARVEYVRCVESRRLHDRHGRAAVEPQPCRDWLARRVSTTPGQPGAPAISIQRRYDQTICTHAGVRARARFRRQLEPRDMIFTKFLYFELTDAHRVTSSALVGRLRVDTE